MFALALGSQYIKINTMESSICEEIVQQYSTNRSRAKNS
jgi:hypothetical protein